MPPGHAVTGTPRVGGFGSTLATCEDGPVHLSPGDRVALLVPGSVAYVELVLALLRRGVFPIPMDPGLTPAERRPLFADLEPHHVVTEDLGVRPALAGLGDPQVGRLDLLGLHAESGVDQVELVTARREPADHEDLPLAGRETSSVLQQFGDHVREVGRDRPVHLRVVHVVNRDAGVLLDLGQGR